MSRHINASQRRIWDVLRPGKNYKIGDYLPALFIFNEYVVSFGAQWGSKIMPDSWFVSGGYNWVLWVPTLNLINFLE